MAILNRYYNFSHPNELVYTYWYVAEIATAVYVGNVPLCWQFISHVFKTGSWASFKGGPPGPQAKSNIGAPGEPFRARTRKPRRVHSMLPRSLFSTNNMTRLSTPGDDNVWGTTAADSCTKVNTATTTSAGEFTKDDIELQVTPITPTAPRHRNEFLEP